MRREGFDGRAAGDWWVLQTVSKREALVCRQLAMQGLEHYAPEFPRSGRTRPGSVRDGRHRMIFPGYVFCRPPDRAAGADVQLAVKRTPGVVRILGDGEVPSKLPDAVVCHLRRRVAEQAAGGRGGRFQSGEKVTIESGPMASLDAIFDKYIHASARVRILVEMMGRNVAIDIDPRDLRCSRGAGGEGTPTASLQTTVTVPDSSRVPAGNR